MAAVNYLALRSTLVYSAPGVRAPAGSVYTINSGGMETITSTMSLGASTMMTYTKPTNGSYTSSLWGSTLFTSTVKVSMNQNGSNQIALTTGASTINVSATAGMSWTTITSANGLPAGATAFPIGSASGTPNYTSISQSATGQYQLVSVSGGLLYTSINGGSSFFPAGLGAPTYYLPFNNTVAELNGASMVSVNGSVRYMSSPVGSPTAVVLTNTAGATATNYIRGTMSGFTSALTVSGWFNLQSYSSNPQVIFGTAQQNIVLYINGSTNTLGFNINGGPGVTTASAITLNTWYYVTAVAQSNANCYLYLNNVLVGTYAMGSSLANMSIFGLGTYDNSTVYAFNGYLDDIRLYNYVTGVQPYVYLPLNGSITDAMGAVTTSLIGSPAYVVNAAVGTQAIHFANPVGGTGSQYIQIPMTNLSNVTFSFWMNPQVLNGTQQDIFFNTPGTLGFYIVPSTNALGFYIPNGGGAGGTNCAITTFSLVPNTWYYITGIFQVNGLCSLYVNNVLIGSATQSGGLGSTWTSTFYLGSWQTVTPYNGYIDDFRIYNTAVPYTPIVPQNWTHVAVSGTGQYMLAASSGTNGAGRLFQSSNYGYNWSQVQTALGAWTGLSVSNSGQYMLATSGGYATPNLSGLSAYTWTQNGIAWTVSASSYLTAGLSYPAYGAFNGNYANNGTTLFAWAPSTPNYAITTGTYAGSATTYIWGMGSIAGDWIQLQSSVPLVMQSYTYAASGTIAQMPKTYYIVGSTDGTNWFPIQYAAMSTTPFTAAQTICTTYITVNQSGTQTITCGQVGSGSFTTYTTTTNAYTYFRLVTTAVYGQGGSASYLELGEWLPIFLAGETYSTNYGGTWWPVATYGSDAYNIVKSATLTKSLSAYITMPAFTPSAVGISFSVWFSLSSAASNNSRILDFGASTNRTGASADYGMYIMLIYNNQIVVYSGIGVGVQNTSAVSMYSVTSPTTLSTNTLYHAVFTVSSTGFMTLYLNGVSNATTQGVMNTQTLSYNWLGRSNWTGDSYIDMSVWDFRMYNRAISAAEVTALYAANQGAAINSTPNYSGITGAATATWAINGITWNASASSYYNSFYYPYFAFNVTVTGSSWNSSSYYNQVTGVYGNQNSTSVLGGVGTVYGEYLQLQSSVPLVMNNYTLNAGGWWQMSKSYYIVGSTDGTSWYPIQYAVFSSNPFNANYATSSTYITVNRGNVNTFTGNVSATLTTTIYGVYTTQAYTYFRLITTAMMGNPSGTNAANNDGVSIGDWTINFANSATQAYTFNAVSGNGQYALMGYGQLAWLTTTLSANTATFVSLPGITANINCASISATGQYMIILTGSQVFYSKDYGVTWAAITLGSTALTSCAMSYDGSYITVSNTTTVYTLNLNGTSYSVAIGNQAGMVNQGSNSVAVGNQAGMYHQSASSIVFNTSGSMLNSYMPGFFVSPLSTSASSSQTMINLLGYGADSQVVQTAGFIRASATMLTLHGSISLYGAHQNAGNSATGGNLICYNGGDNYMNPSVNVFNFNHDNVGVFMSMFWNGGAWQNSITGTNWGMYKLSSQLLFNYMTGATGSTSTPISQMIFNSTGVGIGGTTPTTTLCVNATQAVPASGILSTRYYLTGPGDNQDTSGGDYDGPWYGMGWSGISGLTGEPYVCVAGHSGVAMRSGSGFLQLAGNGNVGIGTTNPSSTLQIHGSGGGGAPLRLVSTSAGSEVGIGFYRNTDQSMPNTGDLWVMGTVAHNVGDRNMALGCNATGSVMTWLSNGTVGVGITNPNTNAKFVVQGRANIHAGNPGAVNGGHMASGSLTIGDISNNYGGGWDWTTNTSGLMMECLDATEIAVHDAGTRVASFMYYSANNFTIGRDMGWGVSSVTFPGIIYNNNFIQGSGSISISGYIYSSNYIRGAEFYTTNWFRVDGGSGIYWQSYGRGIWSADSAGNYYGNVSTYGEGRNGWRGWGIENWCCLMCNAWDGTVGLHNNARGWIIYGDASNIVINNTWNAGLNYASPVTFNTNTQVNGNVSYTGTLSYNNKVNIYSGSLGIQETGYYAPLNIKKMTDRWSRIGGTIGIYTYFHTEYSDEWMIGADRGSNSNLYFLGHANYPYQDGYVYYYEWVMDVCAYIENDNAGERLMNFTGQHRCSYDQTIDCTTSEGLIVCATGEYWSLLNHYNDSNMNDQITIDEALPTITLATTAESASVFGVVSYTEDPEYTRRTQGGRFISVYSNPSGERNRVFVNSLGEGGVWVCNINGNFLNGDFITTSTVPGYGMKQSIDERMNYTMGKITMDCDFCPPLLPVQQIKKKPGIIQQPVLIDKLVEDFKENTEWDEVKQQYIKKKVLMSSKTIQVAHEEEVEVYDENGALIGKETLKKTVAVEGMVDDLDANGKIQWINKVDEVGNIVMKPAYQLRYLRPNGTTLSQSEYEAARMAGEVVYLAAFVGCTYHCG